MPISRFKDAVNAARSAGEAVVDRAQAVKDTVTDTADAIAGYASATVATGKSFAVTGIYAGAFVLGIVAPVPTIIGGLILELMIGMAMARYKRVSDGLEAGKIARENSRILDKLAKHGKVPATALIETKSISLQLDVAAGTITGQVKTGLFSSREIGEMTVAELEAFAAKADPETAGLIGTYLKFRAAQAASNQTGDSK